MWQLKDGLWQEEKFPFFNAVTTRASGNMRDPGIRRQFCGSRGMEYGSLVTAQQVHGNTVAVVNDRHRGGEVHGADGLITASSGLTLAIFTADCLPVFLGNVQQGVAGVVHAGWRGLANGIIAAALEVFRSHFGVQPENVTALIGPHIQKCCYEVGDELRDVFKLAPGETHLDLDAAAVNQLKALGVRQISSNGHCTAHETDLFFSYRREKTAGRIMSLVRI